MEYWRSTRDSTKRTWEGFEQCKKGAVRTRKITDEMKGNLKDILEKAEESETKEEAKDFLEDLPSIERINMS